MNKTVGLIISIILFGMFIRTAINLEEFYLGTCILLAGFMIGDDGSGRKGK